MFLNADENGSNWLCCCKKVTSLFGLSPLDHRAPSSSSERRYACRACYDKTPGRTLGLVRLLEELRCKGRLEVWGNLQWNVFLMKTKWIVA